MSLNFGLVVSELTLHAEERGEIWGEYIDALHFRRALLRHPLVATCELLTLNILRFAEARSVRLDFDVLLHFSFPTHQLHSALNVLYFQEFSTKLHSFDHRLLAKQFPVALTPARALAREVPAFGYFPLAVDPDYFHPPTEDRRPIREGVVFIGNSHMRELKVYERYLAPSVDYGLKIYGSRRWLQPPYSDFHPYYHGLLPVSQAPQTYGSAAAGLSVHGSSYNLHWELMTNRPLHILSCGTPVLSDQSPALASLFPEDSGITYTDGGADLTEQLRALSKDGASFLESARKGRDRVLAGHTWDHRAAWLLEERLARLL